MHVAPEILTRPSASVNEPCDVVPQPPLPPQRIITAFFQGNSFPSSSETTQSSRTHDSAATLTPGLKCSTLPALLRVIPWSTTGRSSSPGRASVARVRLAALLGRTTDACLISLQLSENLRHSGSGSGCLLRDRGRLVGSCGFGCCQVWPRPGHWLHGFVGSHSLPWSLTACAKET
jgi:hypothetical protein